MEDAKTGALIRELELVLSERKFVLCWTNEDSLCRGLLVCVPGRGGGCNGPAYDLFTERLPKELNVAVLVLDTGENVAGGMYYVKNVAAYALSGVLEVVFRCCKDAFPVFLWLEPWCRNVVLWGQ
jgi:hypothetical protein